MLLVYLDQNHWISVGRAYYGRTAAPGIATGYRALRKAVDDGRAVLPLSSVHYIESARSGDPYRRARLGHVMWEMSSGMTLAPIGAVVRHEIEVALSRRFPSVKPAPFTLLGFGVAHAFGRDRPTYELPPGVRAGRPPEEAESLRRLIQNTIERGLLTGEDPDGEFVGPYRMDEFRQNFQNHLSTLGSRLADLPKRQWDDALYAMSLVDIMEPINEILERHDLSAQEMMDLGKDELTRFLNDLPTRAVDMHLHRQVLRNKEFKPKAGDLEDWSALGLAAAWCDVVVCEKHTADLLQRDGFRPKATVLRRLEELVEILQ